MERLSKEEHVISFNFNPDEGSPAGFSPVGSVLLNSIRS